MIFLLGYESFLTYDAIVNVFRSNNHRNFRCPFFRYVKKLVVKNGFFHPSVHPLRYFREPVNVGKISAEKHSSVKSSLNLVLLLLDSSNLFFSRSLKIVDDGSMRIRYISDWLDIITNVITDSVSVAFVLKLTTTFAQRSFSKCAANLSFDCIYFLYHLRICFTYPKLR